MATDTDRLITHREGARAVLLFIHGFWGKSTATFGSFPDFIAADPTLEGWGVCMMGYETNLLPDIRGIWTAKASIATLADRLRTIAAARLAGKRLALVAHSMGGLIVQRALIDDAAFRSQVSHVFLFGTPSAGLVKASPVRFWQRHLAEMDADGPFILDLRARWNATFAKTPAFPFVAVAGETDEFVPRESSIDPFPEDKRAVVPGNHIEMVKPDGPGDESVALVAAGLRGTKLPWSRWAGAWIAVQQGEFQKVIDDLLPDCDSLDERSAVSLALALDAVKRRDEAISVLQKRRPEETDAMGVLAGRIKRRWRASGKLDEGEHALAIYADALRRSHLAGNARQESYHAINVAFLTLALHDDLPAAQGMAREALTACARAPEDLWRAATEGEANLILGEDDAALEHYRRAMARSSKPWEIESMFTQAYTLASGLLKRKKTSGRLEELFGRRVEL